MIKDGVAYTAANVDKSWIGTDAGKLFSDAIGAPVTVLNDADAAGVAEMEFGAGKGVARRRDHGDPRHRDRQRGVPRRQARCRTPSSVTSRWASRTPSASPPTACARPEHLSWKQWAKRLDAYFQYLEALFSPDLIIVGGGVSKKSDKFLPLISTRVDIVPAQLLNEAGIVGAAVAAKGATPAAG